MGAPQLSTLFIMLTFVACEFTETIDESILPKGNAHDLGCDINIVESAYRIIGLSKEKAASYLKEAGWQQLTADSNTFICKDSSMVKDLSSWKGEYKPGPRTTMDIYLDNGIVTSSNLACYCYPEDKPFHQLAEWDAWIYREWKQIEYFWSASFSTLKGEDKLHSYSNFHPGEHEKFFIELKDTPEEEIYSLRFNYMDKIHIVLNADFDSDDNMVQITLQCTKAKTVDM